jgi:hypothetical protein
MGTTVPDYISNGSHKNRMHEARSSTSVSETLFLSMGYVHLISINFGVFLGKPFSTVEYSICKILISMNIDFFRLFSYSLLLFNL